MYQDDQPRKKALLGELGMDTAGGFAPSVDPTKLELPEAAQPAPIADASAPARDFSRLVGYDAGKFNDPNKQSAKYVMGRTLAGFDPSKGLTADVLAGLNGLGYGNFTGQGDKLSLSGLTDAGRKAGLVGDYRDADFNVGLKTGNGKWGYQDPAYEAMHPEEGGGAPMQSASGAPFGGVQLDSALNGDPLAKIREAIAALSAGRPNAAALMHSFVGGGQ